MFSYSFPQRNIDLANLTKPSPLADPYHALPSASTLSDPSQHRLPRYQGRHSLILSPRKTRPRQCQDTTFCEVQRLYAFVPDPDSTSTPRARSVKISSCPNTPAHQILPTLGDPPLETSGRASRTCSVSRGFPALSSLNSAPWKFHFSSASRSSDRSTSSSGSRHQQIPSSQNPESPRSAWRHPRSPSVPPFRPVVHHDRDLMVDTPLHDYLQRALPLQLCSWLQRRRCSCCCSLRCSALVVLDMSSPTHRRPSFC